ARIVPTSAESRPNWIGRTYARSYGSGEVAKLGANHGANRRVNQLTEVAPRPSTVKRPRVIEPRTGERRYHLSHPQTNKKPGDAPSTTNKTQAQSEFTI